MGVILFSVLLQELPEEKGDKLVLRYSMNVKLLHRIEYFSHTKNGFLSFPKWILLFYYTTEYYIMLLNL